ncbi:Hint domain-containing protein [Acetobacter indonesiensis]|uniref:Hint domain-containing protein n=1 Tax=Acetobacter indonesiensis TaxID=104101 RepID=UPI00211B08EA|nr:Hint domain-containing protein [Acetobacter indonesiensis]
MEFLEPSILTAPTATLSGGFVVANGGVLSHWGSVASGGTLTNGATIYVQSGGSADGITVGSGANIVTSSGGLVSGTIVSSGGGLGLAGVASNTTISSGGVIEVASGGTAIGSTLDGGKAYVDAGGVISKTTVENSGIATVSAGASALNTTVETNGNLVVLSGGAVSGTTVSSGGGLGVAGVASNTTVSNGGVIEVASGGTATGSTLDGGKAYVDAGGVISTTTVENSGIATVSAGASALDTTVETNGNLVVLSGGAVSGTTVSSGGGLGLAGVASNTTVNNGGVLDIGSGGTANSNTINSGAEVYVEPSGTLGTTTVANGGNIAASSGAIISGVVTIQNGGSATIWNNAGGTIDLQSDDNAGLTVSGLASGGTLTTVINGFSGTGPGNSDSIDLAGVSAAGASYAYPSDNQVVITLASGAKITLNITGVKNTGFVLVDDGHGGASAEVCFLADSLISTPSGTVAVQDIQIGDKILSYTNGVVTEQIVVWTGCKHTTVRLGMPDDMAGYPVRILKNAIADGVPFKDMLITPEHCLFFDGRFVPARMLVNGSSIFYDRSIKAYDYYHVETHHHAVICADGMLTESYLDTGNRKTFRQEGAVVALRNTSVTWEDHAAAPLCVERSFVEPLFRNLESRSQEIFGTPVCEETVATTSDPDVRLLTETGAVIRPLRQEAGVYSFMLPSGTAQVRIVSRANRPVDVIGPFVDDRRELGIAVGEINLVFANGKQNIGAHLRTEKPEGWYPTDANSTVVWTNGNALLPLGEATRNPMGILSLTLCAAGPYLLADENEMVISLVG